MNRYVANFLKYRGLMTELVVRDIKLKYRRSVLGILWSMLNPLLMMLVLSIVFSTLFKRSIENYMVYLITGKLLFDFFSASTKTAMNSVISSASLIKKVYIPKYMFPISKVLSGFVDMLFSIPAMLLVMFFTGHQLTWTALLAPLPLLYVLVFSIGMGLILSTMAVFFRDIIHLYGVALTALMYLTPIIYPVDIIPQNYKPLILANPMYYFVEMFRDYVMYNRFSSLELNLTCIAISIGTLALGMVVFYKNQDKFILYA